MSVRVEIASGAVDSDTVVKLTLEKSGDIVFLKDTVTGYYLLGINNRGFIRYNGITKTGLPTDGSGKLLEVPY